MPPKIPITPTTKRQQEEKENKQEQQKQITVSPRNPKTGQQLNAKQSILLANGGPPSKFRTQHQSIMETDLKENSYVKKILDQYEPTAAKTIENLKNEIYNYSSEKERLVDQINSLKKQLNQQVDVRTASKVLELEKLNEQLKQNEQQSNGTTRQKEIELNELRQKIDQFNQQRLEQENRNKQLQQVSLNVQNELQQSKQQTINQAEQIQKMLNQLKEKELTINQINSQLGDKDQLLMEIKKQNEQCVKMLQEQIDTKQTFIMDQIAKIKELEHTIQDLKGRIRIAVRIRPASFGKIKFSYPDQLSYKQQLNYYTMGQKGVDGRDNNRDIMTCFDRVFHATEKQDAVFLEFQPLVRQIFDGYKAILFAYGQSGSGKTYTQYGNQESPGIMPQALQFIFTQIAMMDRQVDVYAQFFEIYNDKVFDLLADQSADTMKQSAVENKPFEAPTCRVSIINDTVNIVGLNQCKIVDMDQAMDLVTVSQSRRKTSATILNDTSSRSHAVFQIHISQVVNGETITGSLTIVDLAGSEQIQATDLDKKRKEESVFINKSLSTLSTVFIELKNGGHVPYRECTLTKVLQEYFQGDNKVIMVVCLNEDEKCYQETVNSLQFAQRVRGVSVRK